MEVELGLGHRLEQATGRRGESGIGHDPMLRCRAMKGQVGRVVLAVAWVAIVLVLSLGAAGIVATMTSQPGTDARADLTYSGDAAFEPGLAAAEAELTKLSGEVTQLSDLGRTALGHLSAGNSDQLDATVTEGETLATTIDAHAASIRQQLETLPGLGPEQDLTLSPEVRARQQQALSALDATNGLNAAWSKLAVSSAAASRITKLLTDHDTSTATAADLGRHEKYAEALTQLDQSDQLMAQARTFRDTLSRTVDVSTLTDWLDLNATYDAALRRLYQALVDSKGKVTNEVRAAFDGEGKARKQLPADSKGLVIILAEIGRGGLNQAVITIEQARGELDSAISLLDASESPEAPAPSS
jgi:hypothetical protein